MVKVAVSWLGALAAALSASAAGPRAHVVYHDPFSSYTDGAPMNGQPSPGSGLWASQPYTLAFHRPPGPAPTPEDVTADGLVNSQDLAALLGAWGPCPAFCAPDVDGDGLVNSQDLARLLGAWGEADEPAPAFALRVDRSTLPRVTAEVTLGAVVIPAVLGAVGDPARFSARLRFDQIGGQHMQVEVGDGSPGPALVTVAMGGYPLGFDLGPLSESNGLLRRVCVRVARPGGDPVFYATGKDLFASGLFTLHVEATPAGVRVLIEDYETRQSHGFVPIEIFPAGSYGPARDANGVPAPAIVAPGPAPLLARLRLIGGRDPEVFDFPGWTATDLYVTDVRVSGPMAP